MVLFARRRKNDKNRTFCQLNTKELNYLPEVDHEMLKEIKSFKI